MKVLLVNVHSALNLGDQAIMKATLRGLRDTIPDVEITVAANHPESWRSVGHELLASQPFVVLGSLTSWVERLRDGRWTSRPGVMIWHMALLAISAIGYRVLGKRVYWGDADQRRLQAAYYEADLVLGCGGGNLFAYRALSPFLLWALAALGYAAALGKKIILLPQSIGPIQGTLQRRLASFVLGRSQTILVREPWSQRFVVSELGVRVPVILHPDLAFGLAGSAGRKRAPRQPPKIGATIINRKAQLKSFGGQMNYETAICSLLARLAVEQGAEITLFCQSYGPSADQDDRSATARLDEQLRSSGVRVKLADELRSAQDALDAYAEMDLLIGTRMHTAIFAMCNGTPILLFGYQPKGRGVMTMNGLDRYCFDIETVSAEDLYASASELLEQADELRAWMSDQQRSRRDLAAEWTRYLLDS